MTLDIRPITFKRACAFVAVHHRHNQPPRGHKFSVGLFDGAGLVGVAMAGRPIARAFDDGLTLEINRTCTDGTANANSMLYGACRRAAWGMGYRRCITYIQADETGASLRAAGFVRVKILPPRADWASSSVRLKDMRQDLFGPQTKGGIERVLWETTRGENDDGRQGRKGSVPRLWGNKSSEVRAERPGRQDAGSV